MTTTLRSVTIGPDGAFAGMKKGAIFIDNTTASAQVAIELNEAAKAGGFDFLDAPVSGGQAGAENGKLTVMVGGDEAVFERAKPVIDAYSRMVGLMGPAGSGQLTKMVNQICIAGPRAGPRRGHSLRRQGRPRRREGHRRHFQGRGRFMADGKPLEDHERRPLQPRLRRRLDAQGPRHRARRPRRQNGASLPVTALVDQFYAEVQKMGGNRWDTSSLLARLEAN